MVTLGIDPGSQICGYGVLDGRKYVDCGTLRARGPYARRLADIYLRDMVALLDEFGPALMAIETQFVPDAGRVRNHRSALQVAGARAVAVAVAAYRGIKIAEVAPATAKKAVTGNGAATKEQVQAMVQKIFGLNVIPEPDASDALAVAWAGGASSGQGVKR